jgi:hypothetical protein
VFSNHRGYIFHDSRGFEAVSNEELGIVQEFIRKRSRERRLRDRLHAIWFVLSMFTISNADGGPILRYCIPMDNQRPELDIRYLRDICPDQNGVLS